MLTKFFYGTPLWFSTTFFLIFIFAIACLLSWICNFRCFDKIKYSPDVGSGILSITGTIFAVMLAMVTVDVIGKFYQAQQSIINEADYAGNIFRESLNLPEPQSSEIIHLIYDYLKQVKDKELPAQNIINPKIQTVKYVGLELLDKVVQKILQSQAPDVLKSQLLNSVDSLYTQRRLRVAFTDAQLPDYIWTMLAISWVILLFNVGLMKLEKPKSLYILNFFMTLIIGITIILMTIYCYPFSGPVQVESRPYQNIINNINYQLQR